jgi:hypothetical protein
MASLEGCTAEWLALSVGKNNTDGGAREAGGRRRASGVEVTRPRAARA